MMNGMNDGENPDWYGQNKKGGAVKKPDSDSQSQHDKGQASSHNQSSFKSFLVRKVPGRTKEEIQKLMPLYYFAIGSSFQRIRDAPLKEAIKVLRLDAGLLLNWRQLVTVILDKYHEELSAKADQRMKCATTCLTTYG